MVHACEFNEIINKENREKLDELLLPEATQQYPTEVYFETTGSVSCKLKEEGKGEGCEL